MSADLPSSSSCSHSNAVISVVELPKNSSQTSYTQTISPQNFRPLVCQTLLVKILPVFFFLGGVVIMAKIIHG